MKILHKVERIRGRSTSCICRRAHILAETLNMVLRISVLLCLVHVIVEKMRLFWIVNEVHTIAEPRIVI